MVKFTRICVTETRTVIISKIIQNRTHVYMNFFVYNHIRNQFLLPRVQYNLRESPCISWAYKEKVLSPKTEFRDKQVIRFGCFWKKLILHLHSFSFCNIKVHIWCYILTPFLWINYIFDRIINTPSKYVRI